MWRTGRKVKRTIYRQVGPEPSDDDVLIGVMDTPELAAEAVDARNARLEGGATGHCCERGVPGPSGARQEGTLWTCPTCSRAYVWVIEEAEGAWWARVEEGAT